MEPKSGNGYELSNTCTITMHKTTCTKIEKRKPPPPFVLTVVTTILLRKLASFLLTTVCAIQPFTTHQLKSLVCENVDLHLVKVGNMKQRDMLLVHFLKLQELRVNPFKDLFKAQ